MEENGVEKEDLNKPNNEKTNKAENQKKSESVLFKSKLIEALINKYKKDNLTAEEIKEMPKDDNAINLSDILSKIEGLSDQAIEDIIEDINTNNITIDINSEAIELLNNKDIDQKNIQKLLDGIDQKINIDINSISELSLTQFENISKRCTINRVYVNSGHDESAMDGYDKKKYLEIRTNADLMLEAALGKNPERLSEKDKFKKLYKYIVDTTKYDNDRVADSYHDSRNLDRFFTTRKIVGGKTIVKGKSICAGTAVGLKNLCDCLGLESEYVQGYATTRNGERPYHAWIKVKIDGQWYNADPTWDLNKTGLQPFSYCLKSDKDFQKDHNTDYSYNPTYLRTSNSKNVSLGQKTYHTAEQSYNNFMNEYIDDKYLKKYTKSRERAVDMYDSIPEDILQASIEKKIPLYNGLGYNKRLTLRQRLANFLYKGKHLKKIPFIEKFVNKYSTEKKKSDRNSVKNSNQQQSDSGMYRVDGNLNQAINNYQKSKQAETSAPSRAEANKGPEK